MPENTLESELRIAGVHAEQILDSRGHPTLRVSLELADHGVVRASAPAGASTGAHEAVELRDGGTEYSGLGVAKAVRAAERELRPMLTGRGWASLGELDSAMLDRDGTPDCSRFGSDTLVPASMAAARGFARLAGLSLSEWFAVRTGSDRRMPVPHFNVLNGGAHAANPLEFQEFMVAPIGAPDFAEGLRWGVETYHALEALLRERYGVVGLGDEGGFAPPIDDPQEALDLLVDAIGSAGLEASRRSMAIALDPAANGFRTEHGYRVSGRDRSSEELLAYYSDLVDSYPIWSIEDGFAEDDEAGWARQTERLGGRVQLVGDDLYVTDPARIERGAREGLSTATLIKPNQIGTVTRTLQAIATAEDEGMACMISHRSGETVDPFIADLAVGTGVGQIKSGAPARGERVAKYNRLSVLARRSPAPPYGLAVVGPPHLPR